MVTARVIGTGSYLPSWQVTNEELESMVRNFDEERAREMLKKDGYDVSHLNRKRVFHFWVTQMSGISKRHFYKRDFDKEKDYIGATENMAAEASKKALEAAKISAKEIDYIVMATFTQRYDVPNPACSLAHLIGAKEIGGIPINTACCGFIDAIIDGACRITSSYKHYNTILVVASETLSRNKTDYDDPKTAILFADGAGAAVLQKAETGILGFYSELDYVSDHIVSEKFKPIKMGSPIILKRAVKAMEKASKEALKNSGLKLEDIDYVIPHQANQRITESLIKRLKIPEEKFIKTIKNLGNTSGASVAIALDKAVRGEIENIKIEKGQKLLLTAVGGGYTLSAVVMEY